MRYKYLTKQAELSFGEGAALTAAPVGVGAAVGAGMGLRGANEYIRTAPEFRLKNEPSLQRALTHVRDQARIVKLDRSTLGSAAEDAHWFGDPGSAFAQRRHAARLGRLGEDLVKDRKGLQSRLDALKNLIPQAKENLESAKAPVRQMGPKVSGRQLKDTFLGRIPAHEGGYVGGAFRGARRALPVAAAVGTALGGYGLYNHLTNED